MLAQGPNYEAYCHDDVDDDKNDEEAPSQEVLNLILQEGSTTRDDEEFSYGILQLGKAGLRNLGTPTYNITQIII